MPGQLVFGEDGRYAGRATTCEQCGGVFAAKRSDARFCSAKCKQEAYRRRRGVEKRRLYGQRYR